MLAIYFLDFRDKRLKSGYMSHSFRGSLRLNPESISPKSSISEHSQLVYVAVNGSLSFIQTLTESRDMIRP